MDCLKMKELVFFCPLLSRVNFLLPNSNKLYYSISFCVYLFMGVFESDYVSILNTIV